MTTSLVSISRSRPLRPAGFTPARPYQSECAAGGRYGALKLEAYLGGFALGFVVEFEEVHDVEVEHAGEDVVREDGDRLVVLGGRLVVVLTLETDLVLGAGQLFLELHEVGVGLQVGVALRQREQLPQRTGQHVLRHGLALDT